MSRAPKAYSLNKPVPRVVALLAAVLIAFLLAACASTTQPLQRFGERVSGQHVYDRAGILTPGEIADLETQRGGGRARGCADGGLPASARRLTG